MVLSLGAHMKVGGLDVSLPAYWLKKYFVGFRMIRVPARFNLFAAVAAAVVAAAGLRHLLAQDPGPRGRGWRSSAGSWRLALADLSTVPYPTIALPPMPACYAVIRKADPDATFLDAPQFNSGAFLLPSLCSYWQSIHGGKTSAGYTAFTNTRYDNLLYFNSPFDAFKLGQPPVSRSGAPEWIELGEGVDFRSYVWLYLKVHDLRYVVVHHRPGSFPEFPVHLDRIKWLLQDAKVYEDADTAVYDREKMAPRPGRSSSTPTAGATGSTGRTGGPAWSARWAPGRLQPDARPAPVDRPRGRREQEGPGRHAQAEGRVLARWGPGVEDLVAGLPAVPPAGGGPRDDPGERRGRQALAEGARVGGKPRPVQPLGPGVGLDPVGPRRSPPGRPRVDRRPADDRPAPGGVTPPSSAAGPRAPAAFRGESWTTRPLIVAAWTQAAPGGAPSTFVPSSVITSSFGSMLGSKPTLNRGGLPARLGPSEGVVLEGERHVDPPLVRLDLRRRARRRSRRRGVLERVPLEDPAEERGVRPPPADGLLGGRGQQADRLAAAEEPVVDDPDAEQVAGQDEVGRDPAPPAVNRVPLEGLADERRRRSRRRRSPSRSARRAGTPAARAAGRSVRHWPAWGPERIATASPVIAVAPLRPGDRQDPAVGRDRRRLPLEVEPVGLGEDHLGGVGVRLRVVLARADPALDDVVLDQVERPALGEDEEPPGLARRPLGAGLVAGQDEVVGVSAREDPVAEGVRRRALVRVLDDRPGAPGEDDRAPPERVPLDPAARGGDDPDQVRRLLPRSVEAGAGPSRSSRARVILNLGSAGTLSRSSVVPITAGPKLTSRSHRTGPANRTAKPSSVVPPAWILIAAVQSGWSGAWANCKVAPGSPTIRVGRARTSGRLSG